MMAEDSIPEPSAALASVLAISIAACSTACGGRSAGPTQVRNSANSPATVILVPNTKPPEESLSALRGEREGPNPQGWEGEVGRPRDRWIPHLTPALSAPGGGEGDAISSAAPD